MTPEQARQKIKAWLAHERGGDTAEHPGDHELFHIIALLEAGAVPEGFWRQGTKDFAVSGGYLMHFGNSIVGFCTITPQRAHEIEQEEASASALSASNTKEPT